MLVVPTPRGSQGLVGGSNNAPTRNPHVSPVFIQTGRSNVPYTFKARHEEISFDIRITVRFCSRSNLEEIWTVIDAVSWRSACGSSYQSLVFSQKGPTRQRGAEHTVRFVSTPARQFKAIRKVQF